MKAHIARAIVRCYPRRWRARYGDEVLALVEADRVTGLQLVDLVRGCGSEWRSAARTGLALRQCAALGRAGLAASVFVTLAGLILAPFAPVGWGPDSIAALSVGPGFAGVWHLLLQRRHVGFDWPRRRYRLPSLNRRESQMWRAVALLGGTTGVACAVASGMPVSDVLAFVFASTALPFAVIDLHAASPWFMHPLRHG
jgi:hypothetical protein